MVEPLQARALYRSLWRRLGRLPRLDRPQRLNLQRLLRVELREALVRSEATETALRDQADRTLALLASSPRLTSNLASLTYHHHPGHIPGTPNSARLAHLPKPIAWDPKDPSAALKAWDKRRKDQLRDPVWRISQGVDEGLRRLWREAEDAQGGVWLGRIERARHGP
ncbi:hypothetical protein DMC30DRAFT_57769 [Rhodotorula diobovata]|uniref:Uncharacterized protein n=1 Tax=Rhodotorula diobovata TaxID=5288 RepID=A0A5C5G4G3_9BASI|nr:hypothetical protein DMC30DRAFT_57769 [Rhodotorula diobovata]